MFKIWLIESSGWAVGDFNDLSAALAAADLLQVPCSVQEFIQGRYVAVVEVNTG